VTTAPIVFWTTRDWAEAIAARPAGGPLPCRAVLVPRERVAHALRRELIRAGHASVLAGTRFIPAPAAAGAVLQAAGLEFTPGGEALRAIRLLALFRGPLPLQHFSTRLLQDKPGWDEAFTRTITDLEAAGLSPEALEAEGDARLADVATIWRALNHLAGASWTTARIYREAASVLERQPRLWSFPGPALVTATGHESAVEARFLSSIPGATLGLLAARPVREGHLDRVEALFGRQARMALFATPPRASATERDLLASYFFEPPRVLGDPGRPRSSGPDDTVRLEQHAGIEAEIEATADWVAEQVVGGIALEDIAVLLPSLDPLAALVAERLARVPWHDGTMPVHVAGGLPLVGTAAGARAMAVVRALQAHLGGNALADVLPALRTTGENGRHLSRGAAMDLVWSLGTTGGNPARPAGALEWASRLAAREPQLAEQLAAARAAGDDPEKSGLARQARDLERLLADLRAARPAIEALVRVSRLVAAGTPLAELWPALRTFLADWLLQPGQGPRVQGLLDESLATTAGAGGCGTLTGDNALRVIEETIRTTRLPVSRFGEPAVYVGTVAGAVGLRFAAVRVIGLAEGHLPPLPHEDPVIPDTLRARLHMPTAGDRALAALHALDVAVRAAERRVALSAPRLDLDRSQREPSSVLLEAAAALARPNSATGERTQGIPDTTALQRDAFIPARQAALRFRRTMLLMESAWHDAVAHGAAGLPEEAAGLPPRWRGSPALDLDRIASLIDDGLLGAAAADIAVPGLSPERPISPSRLQTLLQCPYLYLLGTLLNFDEPACAPSLREIEQPSYGSFVHSVAEEIFRAHGAGFCAGERTLGDWLAAADPIVDRLFDQLLEQYPLVGDAVRRVQRERLRTDVQNLLAYEWQLGRRRFVATERVFGEPVPVKLALPGRPLFLRGKIDRIDADARRTFVRDLKTGRVSPRLGDAADPDPVGDVQIAVYGLVTRQLAREWGTPAEVGVAYVGRNGEERRFVDDFATVLAPAARGWLGVAAELLADRAFPRTADKEDCTYCCFRPVCGDQVYEQARNVLASGSGPLPRLLALKQAEDDED
jgi:RecB family exonuclease